MYEIAYLQKDSIIFVKYRGTEGRSKNLNTFFKKFVDACTTVV